LSQHTFALPTTPLFCAGKLNVHVRIGRDQAASILLAPLDLDIDLLADEVLQEGSRVERDEL
jgi:hypothetical protein